MHNLVPKTYILTRRSILGSCLRHLLGQGCRVHQEVCPVSPGLSLVQASQAEEQGGQGEGGGEREEEPGQRQPGVTAETLEKGEDSAEVSAGELDEQLVPEMFKMLMFAYVCLKIEKEIREPKHQEL